MMLDKNILRILGGALLVTLLASFVVFGLRTTIVPHDSILKSKVYPRTLRLSDSIFFKDSTPFAKSYRWDFGDGTMDTSKFGFHRYNQSGNYVVTLVAKNAENQPFRDSFFVHVEGTGYTYTQQDSVFKIIAPREALQGEDVVLRVDGYGSDEFYWDFGDNSNQMTTSLSLVKHMYKNTGSFTVKLYSRNNATPATHRITIYPQFDVTKLPELPVAGAGDGGGEASQAGNDFQMHLQKIIDGANFDQHYRSLLRYVCSNERVGVKVNNQSNFELYTYCQDLRFKPNVVIQSVQLTYDSRQKCVTSVNVAQANK